MTVGPTQPRAHWAGDSVQNRLVGPAAFELFWRQLAGGSRHRGQSQGKRLNLQVHGELSRGTRGFYWHFEDRQALIDETLDSWEKSGTEDVIATVDEGAGEPQAKLRRLFELAPVAKDLFAVELALRDWSRRDRKVAARLKRVDDRRLTYLRSLFVGAYFVRAKPGKRSRAEVMRLAIDRLLDEGWD